MEQKQEKSYEQERDEHFAKLESKKILLKISYMNHSEELQGMTKLRVWVETIDGKLTLTPHDEDIKVFDRLTKQDQLQSFSDGRFSEHWLTQR